MTDIRVATGFFQHPKTAKLRRRLGDPGVIALMRLWSFAAENRPKGTLTDLDAEDVAIAAGWDGDADAFINTLIELRWLDRDNQANTLIIHDWAAHQPWICTQDERTAKARAAAVARWSNTAGMPEALPPASGEHAQSNAPNLSLHSVPPLPDQKTYSPEGDDENPSKSGVPPCPHEKIIAAYHQVLPQCPSIRSWTDKRKSHLKARWREDPVRQNVKWWQELFTYVSKSDFLTGKTQTSNGRPPFVVDLEWIINSSNLIKIIEGKYHRGSAR